MKVFYGKGVSGGIAGGKVLILSGDKHICEYLEAENTDEEKRKFDSAVTSLMAELQEMSECLLKEGRKSERELLEANKLILTAPEFRECCYRKIEEEKMSAGSAVYKAGVELASNFENMSDSYMRERGADIRGVAQQLLNILSPDNVKAKLTEPVIIVADELTPAETMKLNKEKVLGLIVNKGAVNSHTAIIARLWNIPAITGIVMNDDWQSQRVAIDGDDGIVYINPTEEITDMLNEKNMFLRDRQEKLKELIGLANETKSGAVIDINANVGCIEDIVSASDNDAGGIGLFRTEFLFMGRVNPPTEDEQFEIYKEAAVKMQGKPVIIRTLDIGMDKTAEYIEEMKEDNPAIGLRGIRFSFAHESMHRTQLRAILRAAAFGNIRVMYPMITSMEDVLRAKQILRKVREKLAEEGIGFGEIKEGIMIETPAAAIISDLLAKEVDFFSIGTNDLAQYIFAADRQSSMFDKYYEENRAAVLRLIRHIVDNAHKSGISAGICGDMAADTTLVGEFLKMGVDELSVSPSKILELRAIVRGCD